MAAASGDIDGDGMVEVVTGDALAKTWVTRMDTPTGTVIWTAASPYITGPAGTWNRHFEDVFLAGDLDGDGVSEIAIFNNWYHWTGVLKWLPGVGLQTICKSGGPLGGPAGSWNRRNDEMTIVGHGGGVAVATTTPDNYWHGILRWQPAPPPGHLELVEITNVDGVAGARVSKWTYHH